MEDMRAAEGFTRVLHEIQAERAAALLRIAGTLEDLIGQLHRLAREAAAAPDAGERSRARERHQALRQRALRYRWYLEVQRESVGLTRHEALDELYPVPGRLGRDPVLP